MVGRCVCAAASHVLGREDAPEGKERESHDIVIVALYAGDEDRPCALVVEGE